MISWGYTHFENSQLLYIKKILPVGIRYIFKYSSKPSWRVSLNKYARIKGWILLKSVMSDCWKRDEFTLKLFKLTDVNNCGHTWTIKEKNVLSQKSWCFGVCFFLKGLMSITWILLLDMPAYWWGFQTEWERYQEWSVLSLWGPWPNTRWLIYLYWVNHSNSSQIQH